jgi:hypothetical protein
MGNYGKAKHPSDRNDAKGGSSNSDNQTTFFNITKSDAEVLIPILKEIGKAVFPAAAPFIEAAYQAYEHYDAIKEASSARLKGDYKKAARIALEEFGGEVLDHTIPGAIIKTDVDKGAEMAGETASKALLSDEQEKDLAGKVVKGTLKGGAEVVEDKIIDKAAEKVTKDEN